MSQRAGLRRRSVARRALLLMTALLSIAIGPRVLLADDKLRVKSVSPPDIQRGQSASVAVLEKSDLQSGESIAIFSEACVPRGHDSATDGCSNSVQKRVPCIQENTTDAFCKAMVPFELPVGIYQVRLFATTPDDKVDLQSAPFVSLKVTSEKSEGPTLLGVTPTIAYSHSGECSTASDKQIADLTLSGNNFSLAGKDNRIVINRGGHTPAQLNELPVCWNCGEQNDCGPCDIVGTVDQNGRVIKLRNIPLAQYGGIMGIGVQIGDHQSETREVTLSRLTQDQTGYLMWFALAGVAVIVVFLWLILGTNSSSLMIAGRHQNRLTALMLDPETMTYSLSKFQFYLWTFAVVLGYFYLTLVRTLLQGRFEFSDVPDNMPGILLISAGTWIAATGLTSTMGSKGAGPVQPGWADLLTVGGVVVPERVQFVVWTLVGVASFLGLTFLADPGSLQNLPGIPEKFLYLMGISSAGYLGGKIARKPGPIINSTKALWEFDNARQPIGPGNPPAQKLTVTIIGQNLARDAGIRFRDLKVTYADQESARPTDNVLEFVARDPDTTGENLASQLRLIVRDQNLIDRIVAMQQPAPTSPGNPPPASPPLYQSKAEISVTNPDGQMAAWPVLIP